MAYGVYMAAKKLKHYFQEHPIRVVAEAPISEIVGTPDYPSGIPDMHTIHDPMISVS
jgi:hypothetical protein